MSFGSGSIPNYLKGEDVQDVTSEEDTPQKPSKNTKDADNKES